MYTFKDKKASELLQMGIAPVYREFWVETPPRPVNGSDRCLQEATALENKPSKKQQKREKQQKRANAVCFNFARGTCPKGDLCKFSHNLDTLAEQKKLDLPGQCPFSQQTKCAFGLMCRWSSSHSGQSKVENPVFLPKAPLPQQPRQTESKAATGASNDPGSDARDLKPFSTPTRGFFHKTESNGEEISDMPVTVSKDRTEEIPGDNQESLPPSDFVATTSKEPEAVESVRRDSKDGSIPKETVRLPVLPKDSPPINSLDKELQFDLRKKKFDFSKADRLAKDLKIGIGCSWESNDGSEPRSLDIEGPAEKRQKLDSGTDNAICSRRDADSGSLSCHQALDSNQQRVNSEATEMPRDAPMQVYDLAERNKEWQEQHVETPHKANEKKKLDFRDKLYLAPLTTVGNLPFRRICKSLGADITCGEMALATNLLQGQPSEWALLKRHPTEDFFGVQICGGYPDQMTRCAQVLEDHIDVDFVDINMGCPIDIICHRGAGSALLRKPQRLEAVVRGVSAMMTCPLTIKVRRGYDDGEDIAHDILPHVSSWGVSAATLHGRSRQQRYSREADWKYITRCAEAANPLPVIGNGDIFSYTDYQRHLAECPQLATTMIARGALIKPWLFTEIKERRHWDISASERLDMLKKFCSTGLLHWGSDDKGVETTRRFLLEWLSYLCRYIPVGLLEVTPQKVNWRPPYYKGRSDLETLLGSSNPADWVAISRMLLGPTPEGFKFSPKHKSNAYAASEKTMSLEHDEENG